MKTKLRPDKPRLKIEIVSQPTHAEGLGKYININLEKSLILILQFHNKVLF